MLSSTKSHFHIDNIMKYPSIIFAALAIFVASCSNKDEIKDVVPPINDVTLPQGGNTEADDSILALFNRYDSYFRYKFTLDDMNWTLSAGGLMETEYRFTPIKPDSVCNLLNAIRDSWFAFYPEEYTRTNMPRYIYLTEILESGNIGMVNGELITKWKPITSRYISNQIAIANISGKWEDMGIADKRAFKKSLQSTVLCYYFSTEAITLPESFYAVSTYGNSAMSANAARNAGFLINPDTKVDWATNGAQTQQQDAEAYLCAIAHYSSSDWRTTYNGKQKIKQKYEIMVEALKEAGIDVDAITSF